MFTQVDQEGHLLFLVYYIIYHLILEYASKKDNEYAMSNSDRIIRRTNN